MINVSNEFRQLMNRNTDFKENAEITFADGSFLELSEKDFTVTNNGVVDAAGSNGIPLGVALCRSIQIELMNDDDRFSEYDFFGARIRLYLTLQLSETVERIEYGIFTVLTPETYGTTVIITALDDMHKADRDYETTLPFPSTIGLMFRDACATLEISQGTTAFLNDDFVVQTKPEDITFRQLFGYIAMIAGGNARIDRTGRLSIISYDFESLDEIRKNIDGGSFKPWSNPVDLDGGDFTYNTGDVADGGNFLDAIGYHILNNWSNLKVDTDDIVITGVSTEYTDSDNEKNVVMHGTDGYVLKIDNPLIAGNEKNAVALIGNVMVGGRFRQFSGDIVSNPTCEFMDVVAVVDRKSNVYLSFLTDVNFQFFGFTNLKNSAEPALRNSAKSYSDATQTLVAARKLIKNERTAREQAVAQLAQDLQNSSGLFMTQEEQSDGSIIYYMHDKPTLAESMIVWKLTALAFGISTDGGKTYPYGFTVDGTTITRLLYAEGIDADYIDTGAIRINDASGNTMFLADYDSKQVYINAENVNIGSQSVKKYVDSAKTDAINSANDSTDNKLNSYSTIVKMESAIRASAEGIELKASKTYETLENSSEVYERLEGKIDVNADGITAEVNRAKNAEESMSSKISQNADKINLKVEKGYIISEINQTSESVTISASKIDLVGLVNATEFTSKYATVENLNATILYVDLVNGQLVNTNTLLAGKAEITDLNAANARIDTIESDYVVTEKLNAQIARIDKIETDYITADTVKADYMEVANWTSSGYIKASKIDVDDLFSRSIIVNGSFGISGISSFSFKNVDIEWGYINGVKCLVAAE